MTDFYNQELPSLVGKTLIAVERYGSDRITFEASTGESWEMVYEQDCCASCSIEDVVGDLQDLVGAPIAVAEVATNTDESHTWTFYKLATAKGYVTIRWYGCNGYYSETATFRKANI